MAISNGKIKKAVRPDKIYNEHIKATPGHNSARMPAGFRYSMVVML
jgi:hypothetical protein